MICVNSFMYCYYPILAGIINDYEEQVFIIRIKTNMEYSIYYVFLQKQENLAKP